MHRRHDSWSVVVLCARNDDVYVASESATCQRPRTLRAANAAPAQERLYTRARHALSTPRSRRFGKYNPPIALHEIL